MIEYVETGGVIRFDMARTLFGRGWYWTTAYLADGLLVDSGCAYTSAELARAVKGRRVECLVNTHSHEDHFGGNAAVLETSGVERARAHPAAVEVLADPGRRLHLEPYERLLWGMPSPSPAEPVREGDVISTSSGRFLVIETPGHSPDHVCLYQEDRGWLFTGDLYVGGKDRAMRKGTDGWALVRSLERIATLDFDRLFPGAARIPADPRRAIEEKVRYLEDTGGRIVQMHSRGMPARRIAKEMFGGSMLMEAVTCGTFSRYWMVMAFLEPGKDFGARWDVEGPPDT